MIRYNVTSDDLFMMIELRVPGWLTQAKKKTARFKKSKCYREKSGTWSPVKPVFIELQHGKCAYCERKLEEGALGKIEWDVEHFRPKSKVRLWPPQGTGSRKTFPFGTGSASAKGYYLLPYHPLNYLASCKVCNSPLKSDFFPIAAPRRSFSEPDPRKLLKERPFLPYPLTDLDEDPETLLTFQGFICVPVDGSGDRRNRALVTIAFFGLNDRDTLLKDRAEMIISTSVMLDRLTGNPQDEIGNEFIRRMGLPGFRHANCARSFLRTFRSDPQLANEYVEKARAYLRSIGE
jgi:hypothetical protein